MRICSSRSLTGNHTHQISCPKKSRLKGWANHNSSSPSLRLANFDHRIPVGQDERRCFLMLLALNRTIGAISEHIPRFPSIRQTFLTTGKSFLTTGKPFLTTGKSFLTTGKPFLTTGKPFLTTGKPFLTTGKPFLYPRKSFPHITKRLAYMTK